MDELKKHIVKLREDFTKSTLDESVLNPLPHLQFESWLSEAVSAEVPEVQAMTLSTVSPENKPSSRVVYLREFEEGRFWFYGNYESKKGSHLQHNPNACLNFFWPQLERQIRIEGTVSRCEASYSDQYFNARPTESKLGAWASAQSRPLSGRQELEKAVESYRTRFDKEEINRPPYWGGWVLQANYYEFWQGRKSRLHDRLCYQWKNNSWEISRIAP